jgi:molecular chaperone DnaJ
LIEIPKKLNEKQKQLLRDFAETEEVHHLPQRKGFMDKLRDMLKGDE